MPKLEPPPCRGPEDIDNEKLLLDENEFARHTSEWIEQLAQDIAANGLLQPIAVTEDGRVIFGHGRSAAFKKLGWKTIRAMIYAKGLTSLQFRLIRASENLQRNELTPFRKYLLCAGLVKDNGWPLNVLAEHLHLTPAAVTMIMSPSKLPVEWQNAFRDGLVTGSDCYACSKLDKSKWAGLLALKLSGASKETVEEHTRKPRSTEAPKLSRVKLQLSSKVNIVLTGQDLTLDDVAEALTEGQREVRKAREQGIDVKAFNAVMNSKAKAT